jgi:hypothetical protein
VSPRARNTADASVEAKLDEIARLLALLVGRDRPLQETIADMSALGFGPTRIAELVGTTPGYAKVAGDRAKKKRASAKRGRPAPEE